MRMNEIKCDKYPIPKNQVLTILESNHISVNEYAKTYMDHPRFQTDEKRSQVALELRSLRSLGFENGAVYADIFSRIRELGLRPCQPNIGLFLRLSYTDQDQSENCVLSGAHRAPDGAVTVLSEFLEEDDNFPKGLYLRNVGGTLWLRGYICEKTYAWSPEDIFVFERAYG